MANHQEQPPRRVELPQGPIVRWLDNGMREIEPPADAEDWARIIREQVGAAVRVEFVSTQGARWRVAVADVMPVNVGPGPWDNVNPVDVRPQVMAALRQAGKSIDD
jgi:hypothetical protein